MTVRSGDIVFIVEHSYEVDGTGMDEAKLIGVYSSQPAAEEAVDRLSIQPGFRDQPEGFNIDNYTVDEDNWFEGYFSSDEANAG